jgi:DNA replication protein DnaC
MLNQPTLTKMQAMKLTAMAEALEHQLGSAEHTQLAFEDRLGLLVDAEWAHREQRKLTRRLQRARLRHAASIEDVDFARPSSSPGRAVPRAVWLDP